MNVEEIKADGLSREFSVTISVADIDKRIDTRLGEIQGDIKLPGFRPGKAPLKILRQRFSKNVMGEVLEKAVSETSQSVLTERDLRPAVQPKIEITSFEEGADLVYKMGVDIMPEITPMDFSTISLTRLKAIVPDTDVEEALEKMAKDFRKSEPVDDDRAAIDGDLTIIDFKGRVDGELFEGGTGEGHRLELGSGRFVPGFEEQIVGMKKGETKDVKITFPEEYGAKDLAGKDAVFETTLQGIEAFVDTPIDDEFAKTLGLESLEQLRSQMRERIESDYGQASRSRLKRSLLDALHEAHDFEIPPAMVDAEFDQIWSQFEEAKKNGQIDEEDADKPEEELKSDYRDIAVRRVRLGMLLSEVGRINEVQISQDEVNRAIFAEAQKYQGQEQQVVEFYQNNAEALAGLRAPLLEDKVVDFILELATVTEEEVSIEELLSDPDQTGAGAKDTKPAKKATAKKAAKKSVAKKSASKKAASKKAAAAKD